MVDDLVVHMVDSTDEKDTDAVLAAAMSVDKGACIENPGRWQVRREEVSRQVTEILSGQLDTRPSWWPKHDIRSSVMRGFLAGPESIKGPAQVRLLFGVPLDAYINPVMNKADALQGLVGHPFLLAVDVMALTGAMTEIPEIVRGHFGHWSRLSGILLYSFPHHCWTERRVLKASSWALANCFVVEQELKRPDLIAPLVMPPVRRTPWPSGFVARIQPP
jgi:hypothetical protein